MDDKIKIFDATVDVQNITISNLQTLVSHSENIYVIQFHFDESWDGYTKKAVFDSDPTGKINVMMVSDEVIVPSEIIDILESGFRVGVYGIKNTAIKPTVYTKTLIGKLGAYGGDSSQPPTPDQYQQIINLIEAGQLKGEGATIEIGTVETVGSGQPAEVTNSGTETHAIFDFKIPQGTPEGGDLGQIIVRNPNGNTWENPAFVKPDLTEEYYKNVTDSADFPFTDFQVNGNTYQAQGTGKNLYDFKTIFKTKIDSDKIIEMHPNSYKGSSNIISAADKTGIRYFSNEELNKNYTLSVDITIISPNASSTQGIIIQVFDYENSSEIRSTPVYAGTVGVNVKKHVVIKNIVPENTQTCIRFWYSLNAVVLIENIQLEQSETETEFEPYTNLLPAPTPDNPMPIINAGTLNSSGKYEVHMSLSDGTNTQDVTLTSDVELTKWDRLERRDGVWGWSINSAKKVFDGTENWIKYTQDNQTNVFYIYLSNTVLGSKISKCSHFENISSAWYYGDSGDYSDHATARSKYFRMDENITTVEQCKQFFADKYSSDDPVILWYQTENEVSFNPLSEEEQTLLNNLRTYYPQTTFSVEDYATVTGKYVADAKIYIDNKVSELEALVASAYTMGVNSIE